MEPGRTGDEAAARSFLLIVLPALAIFAYCLADRRLFLDGDTNWHLGAGDWILSHGVVPTTDPFSYSSAGRRWVAHEWLSETVMAVAYHLGGWAALSALTGAAVSLAFVVMTAELRRWLGVLSTLATIGVAFVMLTPQLLARPHILALPLLAIWMRILLQADREDHTPPLGSLPLFTLWANLHGSYVFGLAIAGVFALRAVVEGQGRRLQRATRWGGFLLAAVAASAITPHPIGGLLLPLQVMSMRTLYAIGEWRAVNFATPSALEFALFFTLFVLLYRGVRISWERLGLVLLLLLMSLQHVRQDIILGVVAPMLLAEPIGHAFDPEQRQALHRQQSLARAALLPLFGFAALLFIAATAGRLVFPPRHGDAANVPQTALDGTPMAVRERPVFNDYTFGGWLIFKGVRPFIDGRADMYGDDFFRTYLATEAVKDGRSADGVLRRYGVVWTILQPRSPLVQHLDSSPGWRRLYGDRWAIVQVYCPAFAGLPACGEAAPPPVLVTESRPRPRTAP